MAAPAPLHADRGHGRTHTTADRRRSTTDHHRGCLIPGHLNLHRNFHHVDGRDRAVATSAFGSVVRKPNRSQVTSPSFSFRTDAQRVRIRAIDAG